MAHGVQRNGEAAVASHDLCLTVGAAAVADAAGKAPLHTMQVLTWPAIPSVAAVVHTEQTHAELAELS